MRSRNNLTECRWQENQEENTIIFFELSLNNEKYLLQLSFGHDCSGNDMNILWRWKKISFADLQRDKDRNLRNCKGN